MCINFFKSIGSLTNPMNWLRAEPDEDNMLEKSTDDIMEEPADESMNEFVDGLVDESMDEFVDDFMGEFMDEYMDESMDDFTDDYMHESSHQQGEVPNGVVTYIEVPLTDNAHLEPHLISYGRTLINAMWELILARYFDINLFMIEPCWHGWDPAEEDEDRDLMVSLRFRGKDDMVLFTLQPNHSNWHLASIHLRWSMADVWESACDPNREQKTLYGVIVIGYCCQVYRLQRDKRHVLELMHPYPLHVRQHEWRLERIMKGIASSVSEENLFDLPPAGGVVIYLN